ncbi:MAG: T9SS type A sorting domain-containing protein [Paludibacter sp.]|nr:T9SS type A sorting domain-containing protein [Paludibacter sp.]
MTYNAVSVGVKDAVLNIAGGGVTSVSVPLKALSSDEFMVLPASNVSHNGFTANWTVSATAQNYSLNVFTLESDGSTQPAVLLEESFDNGMPVFWDAGGYTDTNTKGSVRLGSGSSNGSISTPPMDLSASGMVLSVKAKRYGSDSNADITVSIDNGEVTKWTTESNSKEFSITLDEFSDASVITFSVFKGRRVYIESVKLEIPAEVYRPVSVAGFPVETGNTLTYPVNGLLENTLYYYSVTALGNDAKESERIAVETQSANAVDKTEKNNTLWIRTQSGVQLKNMSDNYQVSVTDLLGKKVFTQSSSAPELHIPLPQKGLYLLRIQHNQQSETIKVLY